MIRQAHAHEAMTVRDIVLAAYQPYVAIMGMQPGPMLDNYAMRIAEKQLWVLDDDGEIAGLLVLEEGSGHLLLDNIAVRPDRQGLGYGRKLLDFAESEAVRRGQAAIMLYTNERMVDNIAIYTARGYVERERRREKGFDRVYMEKRLD